MQSRALSSKFAGPSSPPSVYRRSSSRAAPSVAPSRVSVLCSSSGITRISAKPLEPSFGHLSLPNNFTDSRSSFSRYRCVSGRHVAPAGHPTRDSWDADFGLFLSSEEEEEEEGSSLG